MKRILVYVCIFICSISMNAFQINQTNNQYEIGEIPGKKRFENQIKGLKSEEYFNVNEISLLQIMAFENDKITEESLEEIKKKDLYAPVLNTSYLQNNKISIISSVGFFGGFGVKIELHKDQFSSKSFVYIDSVEPFKVHPDSAFTNQIEVKNVYQKLTLEKMPAFKENETISGYLEFQSDYYYETSSKDGLARKHFKGKLFFKSKIKSI